MENASKALIIAGAILLSIAIIGIGMYVYQMAAGTIQQANMSGQEVIAYNAEFNSYNGTQTGSNVRALYDAIAAHNRNVDTTNDPSKWIVFTVKTTGSDLDSNAKLTDAQERAKNAMPAKTTILAASRYKISFQYTSNGMIKNIQALRVNN